MKSNLSEGSEETVSGPSEGVKNSKASLGSGIEAGESILGSSDQMKESESSDLAHELSNSGASESSGDDELKLEGLGDYLKDLDLEEAQFDGLIQQIKNLLGSESSQSPSEESIRNSEESLDDPSGPESGEDAEASNHSHNNDSVGSFASEKGSSELSQDDQSTLSANSQESKLNKSKGKGKDKESGSSCDSSSKS